MFPIGTPVYAREGKSVIMGLVLEAEETRFYCKYLLHIEEVDGKSVPKESSVPESSSPLHKLPGRTKWFVECFETEERAKCEIGRSNQVHVNAPLLEANTWGYAAVGRSIHYGAILVAHSDDGHHRYYMELHLVNSCTVAPKERFWYHDVYASREDAEFHIKCLPYPRKH